MLEVQSLRSLSHHRTPRLLDATPQLTTVLADFAKRGARRAPRCIRAAPKKTRDISRRLEAAFAIVGESENSSASLRPPAYRGVDDRLRKVIRWALRSILATSQPASIQALLCRASRVDSFSHHRTLLLAALGRLMPIFS